MKTIYKNILIIMFSFLVFFQCYAENKVWLCSNKGNHINLETSKLDSISFIDPNAFELSLYNKILKSEGGSFTLGITANQAWIAEVNNPIAISLSKSTGVGSDEIMITAMENTKTGSYSSIVTVTLSNGDYRQLIITVYDKDGSDVKVSPEEIYLPYNGGIEELAIYTKHPWKATVSEPSLISLSKKTGRGNDVIEVYAINNAENQPYSSIITIEFEDGTKTDIPVNVSIEDCYINVSSKSIQFPMEGGDCNVIVKSNTIWSAKSNCSWVKLSKNNGKYDDEISVHIEPSKTSKQESATISFNAYSRTHYAYSKAGCSILVKRGEEQALSVTPSLAEFDCKGGELNVELKTTSNWKIKANKEWVTFSPASGNGDAIIHINVQNRNEKSIQDTAEIIYIAESGIKKMTTIVRTGYTSQAGEILTDCSGNQYKTVWINGYNWMAENLRVDKYDTESESVKSGKEYPDYKDASSETLWRDSYYKKLSDTQIKKLGYLYTWTSAIGVDEVNPEQIESSIYRQGICPNGWHIPSEQDMDMLSQTTVDNVSPATCLKTTAGWYRDGNGKDKYGFSALPAGYYDTHNIRKVGAETSFWTTKNRIILSYNEEYCSTKGIDVIYGASVRCVNNLNISGETKLTVSPSVINVDCSGGEENVVIKINKSWGISSDSPWITLSSNKGSGESTVKVTVASSLEYNNSGVATLTVKSEFGQTATITVYRASMPYPEKCKASDYPQVVIGKQVWMAENYRCSKYDTESEAFHDENYEIKNFIDAANLDDSKYDKNSISEKQILTLGYLFSWENAVGIKYTSYSEYSNIMHIYDDKYRQGICPNGWHIPSEQEYKIMIDYIGGENIAGYLLKSKAGWAINDYHKDNLDKYGFGILPTNVDNTESNSNMINASHIVSASNHRLLFVTNSKDKGALDSYSDNGVVRCLRNSDSEGNYFYVKPLHKYNVENTGGNIEFDIKSNLQWTLSTNKEWIHPSSVFGKGDTHINITADGITELYCKSDTATISIKSSNLEEIIVHIIRDGYNGQGLKVYDVNGRSYPTIWINGQNWMAENLKCNKYDTMSEAYKEGRYTVPTSEDAVYTPYYTDASDKSKWSSYSKESGVNLTDAQVAKLGYLYNWAAAVGITDGEKQISAFSGKCQGICPNGWHVPSITEWQMLNDYIEYTNGKGAYTAGEHLKATSGWHNGGNGLDSYGFAALPASYSIGKSIMSLGNDTGFWTTTSRERVSNYYLLTENNSSLTDSSREYGRSVRCLRD